MTNEERDALVFGVEIRDTDEDGEEVTTLFVDGERVWSDTHFEPEDILLCRDLRAFVDVIRKLAKERHEARAQLAALHAAAVAHVRQWHAGDTEIGACDERLDATLANLATATAEHDARVRADERAKALREVIAYLEAESADDTRDYCTHLRAMADEAERGTR